MSSSKKLFVVDAFCVRQWEANYSGSRFYGTGITQDALEQLCNTKTESDLVPGYAPFCKHIFLRNTLSDKLQAADVLITPENEKLIRSGYEARTPKELAVLTRWIDAKDLEGQAIPPAQWLDVILYSREQIRKESAATGAPQADTDAPWGIISVKAQGSAEELPMTPMTVMRNALGKEEGGSGVPLNRQEYEKSVEYWSKHVFIRL